MPGKLTPLQRIKVAALQKELQQIAAERLTAEGMVVSGTQVRVTVVVDTIVYSDKLTKDDWVAIEAKRWPDDERILLQTIRTSGSAERGRCDPIVERASQRLMRYGLNCTLSRKLKSQYLAISEVRIKKRIA